MKLVGSKLCPDVIKRTTYKDTDYLCTHEEYEKFRSIFTDDMYETLVDRPGHWAIKRRANGDILEYDYRPTTERLLAKLNEIPLEDIDLLYMLKMSHRYLKNSPHFLKTMRDIQKLREHGAKIPEEYKGWFKEREKETYNYGHPKLNQDKRNFFNPDSNVLYTYDHDSIHNAVAVFDRPAYTYYKDDEAEVWCSKKKFFELPEEYRLAGVYEESAVLALERCLIPFTFKPHPTWAFRKALEKVCTSITSGWFRAYAWENYDKVMKFHMNDPLRYANEFNYGILTGTVVLNGDQDELQNSSRGDVS